MTFRVVIQLSGLTQTSGTNPVVSIEPTTIPGVGAQPFYWDMSLWDYANWDVTTNLLPQNVTEREATNVSVSMPYPYRILSVQVPGVLPPLAGRVFDPNVFDQNVYA